MALLFGALAFIILALILLLFPSRFTMKGKLVLIILIMILSLVSYMANTFLALWQTIGMISLLSFLFTYLLSKRESFLFRETEDHVVINEKIEDRKHKLPIRITGSTVFNPVIKSPVVEDDIVDEREKPLNEEFILSDDFSNQEQLEDEPPKDIPVEVTNIRDRVQSDLDTDLEVLLNRYTISEDPEPVQLQTVGVEQDVANRDLESLFEELEVVEMTIEEVQLDERSFNSEELSDHVIEEIELPPIKKSEEKIEKQSYTPFELIEEIKDFKKDK